MRFEKLIRFLQRCLIISNVLKLRFNLRKSPQNFLCPSLLFIFVDHILNFRSVLVKFLPMNLAQWCIYTLPFPHLNFLIIHLKVFKRNVFIFLLRKGVIEYFCTMFSLFARLVFSIALCASVVFAGFKTSPSAFGDREMLFTELAMIVIWFVLFDDLPAFIFLDCNVVVLKRVPLAAWLVLVALLTKLDVAILALPISFKGWFFRKAYHARTGLEVGFGECHVMLSLSTYYKLLTCATSFIIAVIANIGSICI